MTARTEKRDPNFEDILFRSREYGGLMGLENGLTPCSYFS